MRRDRIEIYQPDQGGTDDENSWRKASDYGDLGG